MVLNFLSVVNFVEVNSLQANRKRPVWGPPKNIKVLVNIQQTIQDTEHVDLNRGKGLNMTAFPVLQSALLVTGVYGSQFFLHKLMKMGICACSS